MSEKMELKSCPFCRATPHRGPTRMITDQIHGEKIYRYKIWCPHGCATIDRPNEAMTIEDWNTRASSPAQEPITTEPVAWTNEAQLGFLKEPGYRVVPMAMWAFQHSAHPIALYVIPAPPQPGPEEIAEHLYTKFCADPSIEWQDAPEKLKDVWRRYAGEIAALSGEEGKSK